MAYAPPPPHHHHYGAHPPPPPPQPQQLPQRPPDLSPLNGQRRNLVFSLEVVQQPERARMCGFGDKDRRPITPPPCVRLIIKDTTTGREVNPKEIYSTHFVLHVDLYKGDGSVAANLVRHANNTPSSSISMATTVSFPPPPNPPSEAGLTWVVGPNGQHIQVPTQQVYPDHARYPQPSYQGGAYPAYPPYQPPPTPGSSQGYGQAQGNYTRNLIGSVAVSAALLADTAGKLGFWFILQDLSVRQEGTFRLKLTFADVSELGAMLANKSAQSPGTDPATNSKHANNLAKSSPILATCFSEPFHVHSAKKFPGVKESTALSKCFAQQGVKIPIRKEGKNPKDEDDDD